MSESNDIIVTINGGSSSVKYAAFAVASPPRRITAGNLERIGGQPPQATADEVGKILHEKIGKEHIAAIGHRIVHGGVHIQDHQRVTPELLQTLREAVPLDLAHLPGEIALVEAFQKAFPKIPHVACFDTAFHRDMPTVARLLPIPRRFTNAGLRRFGFHGLSYSYLMQELERLTDKKTAGGKIILAHLGSGASMAAVSSGKPMDTTMAFTPLAGLVMGTRPGDLDPGLVTYLMRTEKMTPEAMDAFLNRQCGLLGVSESSADVRDLLARRDVDPRAAEAINLFCYDAAKHIGALAAAMIGVDTLVFSAGVGEHSPDIRRQICDNLTFLGVSLDPLRNKDNAPIISGDASRVTVRVIPTDEEIMIAQITMGILKM